MNKILFVVSHLHSGSKTFLNILNENPRLEIRDTGWQYNHPQDLDVLTSLGHKMDSSAAVYGDHLLYNTSLLSRAFYEFSNFVYFVREAKPTLNRIVSDPELTYTEETACRYYCFRLRRMFEMARRTPGAVFLTKDDLPKSLPFVEKALELKYPLEYSDYEAETGDVMDADLVAHAQDAYEQYLYRFKQLDLRFPSSLI